tara:strand:- start:1421 stop:1609 length:189 start_codon:yes stop_codon:yes gene_type:complete
MKYKETTIFEYTETELKFKELHKEILNLELYELASNLSNIFYRYGHDNYIAGIEMIKEINNL